MEAESKKTRAIEVNKVFNNNGQHQDAPKEKSVTATTASQESTKLGGILEFLVSQGKMNKVMGEVGSGEESITIPTPTTSTVKTGPFKQSPALATPSELRCPTIEVSNESSANDSTTAEAVLNKEPTTHSLLYSLPPGKIFIDEKRYEGLLIRLGQLEAEKRYLLDYQAHQAEQTQELKAAWNRIRKLEAELDQAKQQRGWWQRLWGRD